MFALGALTALHDAGLWDKIRWICSVSGGSFANSATAVRLGKNPTTDDFDRLLKRGVTTAARPLSLLGCPGHAHQRNASGWIAKVYSAGILRSWVRADDGERPCLADLERADRIHAFMAVDLASSAPVAMTDRLVFAPGMVDELQVAYTPGSLPLVTAVRASATFPGLPAVRIRTIDLGEPLEPTTHDLFLVDGGAWNNLGTDWACAAQSFSNVGVLPASIPRAVDLHFIVDASAPPRRPRLWFASHRRTALCRPGVTLLRAFRTAIHSTVSAHRAELRSGQRGVGPTAVVDLEQWPELIDPRTAMDTGLSSSDWVEVARRNKRVRTGWPSFVGLRRRVAIELLAHAHAQVHAHLTRVGGVSYGAMATSFDRFERVFR